MHRPHSPNPSHTGVALILIPLAVLAILAIFAWPAARTAPRDLPLGLVGPGQAVSMMEPELERNGFDVFTYADASAAREAIGEREVYGAIIAGPEGTRLLVASAASPAVAQLLQQATTGMAAQANQPPPAIEDVVPAPDDDPRGAVLSSSMLPLVLAGIASAAALSRLTSPGWTQLGSVVALAALNGMVAAWVTQTWLGALDGSWWSSAGVYMLMQLAIIGAGTGAHALWGLSGLGIVSATVMLFGNPWSGVMSAPELMPDVMATVGQLLPPGATGTLLRSTAFFDGAASGGAVTVLLAWIALGLGGLAWAAWQRREALPVARLATR